MAVKEVGANRQFFFQEILFIGGVKYAAGKNKADRLNNISFQGSRGFMEHPLHITQ